MPECVSFASGVGLLPASLCSILTINSTDQTELKLPYFFNSKMEVFPSKTIMKFQIDLEGNSPKLLDPSYKTDLDFWDLFRRENPIPGLPWSGKNIWKMKFFPGQGKVREFCGWPGKFIKDLESQGI